ncbi:LytTR family transcriptional regulator [Rudanella paleaurantiibacter]|uniref:LytTR family transcriptional regulator n=1 Tax=Rudanella paleaurantiibacter TaxID=2614655 RepID=A0A7J5U0F8_9BACT|nr:LytTR family DNA-binding domain-containing protein [Rudanella paleaurantiibacter]KAB7731236.1 LytTR family transcriptional regulator [Rudanella paleaurantiibacter]
MVTWIRRFLARPLAEDFSFRNQLLSSIQGGVYVFLFIFFFIPGRFTSGESRLLLLGVLSLGVTVSTLLANYVVPRLLPRVYDEDRWTVGQHILHTIFTLFCISLSNHLILTVSGNATPPFLNMLLMVTLIGFFPITMSVVLAQQRQLKRNLRRALQLNEALPERPAPTANPTPITSPPDPAITFVPTSGKDRLTIQPAQLLAIESVGNYLDFYWLNGSDVQKTTLRLTLKEAENKLAAYPQFFRCHRAFLVNLDAIRHTSGNARGYQLTLHQLPQEIPVARGYVEPFEARMEQANV